MPKLIIIHTQSDVTQTDLENILTYDAQIVHLQEMRNAIAAGILLRLTSGAGVEDGSRTVDLDTTYAGKVRRQKLRVW